MPTSGIGLRKWLRKSKDISIQSNVMSTDFGEDTVTQSRKQSILPVDTSEEEEEESEESEESERSESSEEAEEEAEEAEEEEEEEEDQTEEPGGSMRSLTRWKS